MQIIRKRQRIVVKEYALCFIWKDAPGSSFSFPCNKEGVILREQMYPEGLLNLQKCLSGEYDVLAEGVVDCSHAYYEPAQGRCVGCGNTVELEDPLTNTCDCELEYNMSGQLLAPRSQWEEVWEPEEGVPSYREMDALED